MKNEVNGELIDFDSHVLLPYVEGWPDTKYTLINDGMCGAYRVFGILVAADSGTDEGWKFTELSDMSFDKKALIAEYVRLFSPLSPPPEPKMFIFSHFS